MDQVPDVSDGRAEFVAQLHHQLISGCRVAWDEAPEGASLDVQSGQLCAQTVVQVTPEASPLLLPGCYQAFARALEVGSEPDGVHSDLSLAGEILQQAPVGIGEAFSGCPGREYQVPYLLPLVYKRQGLGFSHGRAVGRSAPRALFLVKEDGRVGQLESLGDGLGDRGQHALRGEGCFQAPPQARDHRIRIISLAVHQAVHAALESAP
jgi:hypothetical protein